jgi:hypothetical protein
MTSRRRARLVSTRWTVARTAAFAGVIGALVACGGGSDDDTAASATWCRQLDAGVAATMRLEDLATGDPGFADALDAVQEQMGALAEQRPPAAIAADWAVVSAPPATTATGATQPTAAQTEAGRRVAAWALANCELSDGTRTGLEAQTS